MLEELQRRSYAKTTVQYYIQAVERFAKHFHRPPDQLNQTHLREYKRTCCGTENSSRGRSNCMSLRCGSSS